MSLLCRLFQRITARDIVLKRLSESRGMVAKHLARCPECRAYQEALRRLARELPQVAAPPTLSEEFETAVWLRAQAASASPRPAPILRLVVAPLALGVLALWGWNRLTPAATPHPMQASVPLEKSPTPRFKPSSEPSPRTVAALPAPHNIASAPTRAAPKKWKRKAQRRTYLAKRPVRPRGQVARSPAGVAPSVSAAAQTMNWAAWGAWYEAQGAYREATYAYDRAYQERSDPKLALAAGRAAEQAGDAALALTYYSKSLHRTSGKKREPEEGYLSCPERTAVAF